MVYRVTDREARKDKGQMKDRLEYRAKGRVGNSVLSNVRLWEGGAGGKQCEGSSWR